MATFSAGTARMRKTVHLSAATTGSSSARMVCVLTKVYSAMVTETAQMAQTRGTASHESAVAMSGRVSAASACPSLLPATTITTVLIDPTRRTALRAAGLYTAKGGGTAVSHKPPTPSRHLAERHYLARRRRCVAAGGEPWEDDELFRSAGVAGQKLPRTISSQSNTNSRLLQAQN